MQAKNLAKWLRCGTFKIVETTIAMIEPAHVKIAGNNCAEANIKVDTYADFQDLNSHEKIARDFRTVARKTDSRVAVMAIHGGGIEPGTSAIADAIAGADCSFYSFEGIKASGNRVLHITADRFDEPAGVALAKGAETVLSIHGCRGARAMVYVGGSDVELGGLIRNALKRAGFLVEAGGRSGLRGIHPRNICNRGRSAKGVQIEISEGQRKVMFENFPRHRGQKRAAAFTGFIETVRAVISSAAVLNLASRS
jgi:phage replication-related protein YjqB (UPF0714/DUF867 family)